MSNKSFSSSRIKTILLSLVALVLLFVLIYLVVFGRALRQSDDHLGIALAIPSALCGDKVAEVDPQTFLTRDATTFRQYMESHGYVHIDQLGSAHFYDKEGIRYLVTGRMYSAFFMVFHVYSEERE